MFVNGVNLGRYWPNLGPQVRLFVPKFFLKKGKNSIALIELEKNPCENSNNCYISFRDTPLINSTVIPGDFLSEIHGNMDKFIYRGNLTHFETETIKPKSGSAGKSKLSFFQFVYKIVMKIVESRWGVFLL